MSHQPPDSREMVGRALRGLPNPRPVTGPLAVHYCAGMAGVSIREYTTDARVLADCVVRYHQRFRPDAVWLSADTWVTAGAMGAAVDFLGDNQPMGGTGSPAVRTEADVDRIPPPDPSSQGRWPLMLEALRLIRRGVGDQVFVVACFDQYPFSLACALMGIDAVMLQVADDPSLVEALMQRCVQYGAAYGRALAEAGADMLSGGDSPAGLIGPEHYRRLALPPAQRLIAELKSACDLPVSLHICGDASPILPDMAASGADVLELDYRTDISAACRAIGPDTAIWGNLDPVGVLARATPQQVRQTTRELLEAVQRCGHRRFVLSSGCTLAMETPAENLDAMLGTANDCP